MLGGRRFCAGLLFAALASAQDVPSGEPANGLADPFADPVASLAEAKGKLAEYPDPATDEAKRWRGPIELRIRLLEELLRTEQERKALPSLESVETRRTAAQRAIDELRAKPPPTSVTLESPAALSEYDKRLAEERNARDRKQAEVGAWTTRHAEGDAERKALAGRESDAKRRLADFEKRDDALSRYRAANARGELRVLRERTELLDLAAPLGVALPPVLGLELDLARLRQERAEQEQKLAAAEAARLREEEARRIREAAEAEARAAERADDPLERFRLERSAEATRLRSEEPDLQRRITELDAAIKERQELKSFVEQERASLESRLARGDEGTTALLRGVRDRARRSRMLLRSRLVDLDVQAQENQRALTAALDRLWDLEIPAQDNEVLQKLIGSVPPSRDEEARRVFTEAVQGSGGVIAALRTSRATRERIETALSVLTGRFLEHDAEIERLLVFVEDRILWIRSEPTLDAALLSAAAQEVVRLPAPYARTKLWSETGIVRVTALAGLAVAIFFLFLLAPRLRARAFAPPKTPGWRSSTRQNLLGLFAAALPAGALYGASLAVRALGFPDTIDGPVPVILDLAALLLLVRRLASFLLREGGLAVTTLGLPARVAAQLLGSVRLITIATLLLRVPAAVIEGDPFHATALPRLLDPVWFAALGFALFLLVRRKGAIVQELTRPGSWMRGVWSLMALAVAVLVLVSLILDVLGYRTGAAFLIRNAARTVALLIAIAGFYSSLLALVGRIAARVRQRTMRQEGAIAAWEVSEAVVGQLTRLVAAVVAVAAILLFLRFWGLSGTLVRALGGVHLLQLSEDDYLSLWNVTAALLWVVGGHFVVRNLSAVYDAIVSPLLGKTDAAGRYVFLALSRYAILLLTYGIALVTLKVSFASIGWLLAAISFGVGFGLQEIVANFISGLIILLERPIRVGDLIEVDGTVASVDRINIRSTTVTNLDRQTIIIPNKQLITQNLTNWTRNDRIMRRRFRVGVAYGSDVEKVLRALDEEVRRHPHVLNDPAPAIRFVQFGESSLDFDVYFFATIEDGIQAMADLHKQVNDRFAREKIEIPFPQRDLHLRTGWERVRPDAGE